MIEIREITPGEDGFLAEMLREAVYFRDLSKKDELLLKVQSILETYFDGFGKRGDLALVLVTDGSLSGAVWTRLYTQAKHSFGFVDESTPELGIALKEPLRNKGFGTRLMAAMEAKLLDEGFDRVSLSVDKQNPAAGLYRRLGFQVHSETSNSYTMLKRLG